MKKLVIMLFLGGFFGVARSQDITALKKDPDVILIKKITDKLKTRPYKMPPNMGSSLQMEMAKNPSPESMKAILKKNGMTDADAFVDDLMLQRNAMSRFNKNHPEFMKMDLTKRMEVMRQLLSN